MSISMEELIVRCQNGDQSAKETLVVENAGLVWSIAKRYFGRGVDPDDLYQLGCLGLIKAIDGFKTDYGTQFSTYAVPKIAGEIRRFLRDDGSVKVSRSIKERSAEIKMARQRLTGKLDREPTLSELAEELDMSVQDIAAAELATAGTESIQKESGEDGFTLEDVLTMGSEEETLIERISVREAVSNLPDREKRVIGLRYYHGLTQDRTARIMGISQVQVSRIEKKALQLLRSFF